MAGEREAWRAYEARLLEFVRLPVVRRSFGAIEISLAQDYVLRDLVRLQSERAVPLFKRWLRSTRAPVRAAGAQHLAWFGSDRELPTVLRLLRSPDYSLARTAANGAMLAAVHGHASKRYSTAVYRELVPIATGARRVAASERGLSFLFDAVEAMIAIDRGAALRLLTSSQCMHPGTPAVRPILLKVSYMCEESPERYRKPFDAAVLWPVFEAAQAGKVRERKLWQRQQIIALTLQFAAEVDPGRARREATEILKGLGENEDGWVSFESELKAVLRRCKGAPEPMAALNWLERNPTGLSRPASEVLRAYELAAHVNTDGLSLYFHNLGEHYKEAVAGLRRLRLERAAAAVEGAARALHPRGRLPRPDACRELFNAASGVAEQRLKRCGERYERQYNDAVFAAVERYMGANAEQFAAVRSRRGQRRA